jgi:hypothetical protein
MPFLSIIYEQRRKKSISKEWFSCSGKHQHIYIARKNSCVSFEMAYWSTSLIGTERTQNKALPPRRIRHPVIHNRRKYHFKSGIRTEKNVIRNKSSFGIGCSIHKMRYITKCGRIFYSAYPLPLNLNWKTARIIYYFISNLKCTYIQRTPPIVIMDNVIIRVIHRKRRLLYSTLRFSSSFFALSQS